MIYILGVRKDETPVLQVIVFATSLDEVPSGHDLPVDFSAGHFAGIQSLRG